MSPCTDSNSECVQNDSNKTNFLSASHPCVCVHCPAVPPVGGGYGVPSETESGALRETQGDRGPGPTAQERGGSLATRGLVFTSSLTGSGLTPLSDVILSLLFTSGPNFTMDTVFIPSQHTYTHTHCEHHCMYVYSMFRTICFTVHAAQPNHHFLFTTKNMYITCRLALCKM